MRWSVALYLGAALAAGSVGCRNTNSSRVESQLRARESDVQTLKGELDRSEFHNGLLVRELAAVRGVPGPLGVVERPSEPYPVRTLRLGRGTGGRPGEHVPGDDALEVLVEPVDSDNQVIKAPGLLHLEVQEVAREGIKTPLSTWDVSPDQLKRSWQNGLFSTGYKITLPWKVWPSTEKLRVTAQFQMLNGRVFEADRDVTVRVVPEKFRPKLISPLLPAPTPEPGPPSTLAPVEPIPMPDGPGPAPKSEKLPAPKSESKPALAPAPAPLPAPTEGPNLAGAVKLLRPVPMPLEQ